MSEGTSRLSRARFVIDDIKIYRFYVYKCVISSVVHKSQVAKLTYR